MQILKKNTPIVSLVVALFLAVALAPVQAQKLDLNANSLSDVWEAVFFGSTLLSNGDDDGDGVPNVLESIAATNPFDSNSVPRLSFSSTATNVTLTIAAALGKKYEWQSVQGVAGVGTSNWTT